MRSVKVAYLFIIILVLVLFLSGCSPTNQAPNASFNANPQSGKAPLEVDFDASSSSDPDGFISTYEWEFGDGDIGEYSNPSHTFDSTGNYTVKLTVYDDEGASDSTNKHISVSGHKLDILDWTFKESLLGDWVEGKVKNVCGRTIDYAEIKAKFYNSDDNRVGSNFTNITDFEAGGVWEFEINSFENPSEVDYAEVEVADVSIY